MATLMKVFKNLFGRGDKIHVDEIALKHGSTPKLLSDAVIVDSGSNANGSYVRFGNGIQICWVALYHADLGLGMNVRLWTYPKVFSAPPTVLATMGFDAAHTPRLVRMAVDRYPTVSSTNIHVELNANSNGISIHTYLFAIGRWK